MGKTKETNAKVWVVVSEWVTVGGRSKVGRKIGLYLVFLHGWPARACRMARRNNPELGALHAKRLKK